MRAVKGVIVLLVVFCSLVGKGQTYPVQAFLQITPPYTSYLPDYGDPFNNQFKVLLTFLDFAEPSYDVKLRFTFEGPGYSMTTTDLVPLPSTNIVPGIPVEISGSDLSPYLSTSNLIISGIDVADYEKRKVLPDGPCTICVEVIDFNHPNQPVISNQSCTQVWFALYEPPLLNLPFCGTEISPTDPQNIVFSWTPLHMASPFSVGTEYIFELFEIRPDEADPNQVVNSSLPIYIEATSMTLLNYNILQPQLQIGMSYAWRVRAVELSGRDAFQNQGYSEVCTFTYGNIAGALAGDVQLELKAQGTGVGQGLCWWNGTDLLPDYELQVRKTGGDYSWFPYPTGDFQLKVNGLEPETEYEARVKGISGGFETDWSNTATFTTQPKPNYECGSTALPGMTPHVVPLVGGHKGMIFTIGQFELATTTLNALGTPGHYSGFGKITVPFAFINLKVKFDDVLVDENLFVRSGQVTALTKGMDQWLDDIYDGPFEVPGIIDGYTFHGDSSVTVTFNDEELTFDFPDDGGPIRIKDESGLIYTFYPDGRVEKDGELSLSDDVLYGTADHQIVFEAAPDQTMGFDAFVPEQLAWKKHYEAILLLDSTYYFTPYKSMGPGESDVVIAKIISDEDLSPVFVAQEGGSISIEQINATTYKLTLSDFNSDDFIYANVDGQPIGKLWVKSYAPKSKEVIVVPLEGTEPVEVSDIKNQLNTIYAQANVAWEVSVADTYANTDWDLNADGELQAPEDLSIMSKFSDEMRALRDNYFADHDQEKVHYLFVVPGFSGGALDGYMVRGRGIGFVQSGADIKTYAHELAHGAFDLEHSFPAVDQGTSSNLLDYSDGTQLTQRQWEDMHQFTFPLSFLDETEDGGMLGAVDLSINEMDGLLTEPNDGLCALALNQYGIVVDLSSIQANITDYAFSDDRLKGVRIEGLAGKTDGSYTAAISTKRTSVYHTEGTNYTSAATGSAWLIYSGDISVDCPEVENADIQIAGCHTYIATLPNGQEQRFVRNLPDHFKIKLNSQDCAIGTEVLKKTADGSLSCGAIGYGDCEGGDDYVAGGVSDNDVVTLGEIPDDKFCFTGYSWLNHESKPVLCTDFTDLFAEQRIHSFKAGGILYVGVFVEKPTGTVLIDYVNNNHFIEYRNELGREVTVGDLKGEGHALTYLGFEYAGMGDIVHYRHFVEGAECTVIKEYEFEHDGRDTYNQAYGDFQGTGVYDYTFDDVTAELVANNDCADYILCDAIATAGVGVVSIFEDLKGELLIPEKFWNPSAADYDARLYDLYNDLVLPSYPVALGLEGSKEQFAYVVGLVNGVVTELAALGEGIGYIAQILCDAEMRESLWDAITNYDETFEIIKDGLVDEWSGMNNYQRAEFSGRTSVAILSVMIPLSKVKWISMINKSVAAVKKLPSTLLKFLYNIKNGVYNGFEAVGAAVKQLYYKGKKFAHIGEDAVLIIDEAAWLDDISGADKIIDELGEVDYKIGDGVQKSDELVVVEKDGEIGVGVKKLPVYKGISFDDYKATVADFSFPENHSLAVESYHLWGEDKWSELEELFKTNDLNNYGGKNWPPFNGATEISKIETHEELAGKVFDRFQMKSDISGQFASPVYSVDEGAADLLFTYDSRALGFDLDDGTYYIKFQIKADISEGVIFEFGDVIPWFNKMGLGEQIRSSVSFDDLLKNGQIEVLEKYKLIGGAWIVQ